MNIKLNDDGKVTRDGKEIATVDFESREIEWGHWQFKKKYEPEVVDLIEAMGTSADSESTASKGDEPEIVEAPSMSMVGLSKHRGVSPVESATTDDPEMSEKFKDNLKRNAAQKEASVVSTLNDPAPPKSSLGDRSPGYPEWFLRQNGQEAYEARYHVRGMNRHTGKRLNE